MDNSAEEAAVVEVARGDDLRQPERPRVRRRLVQSTLFPHKSQDSAIEKEDEDCDEDDGNEEEEEEYCGSRSKKKRKRKPRASKKVAVDGKEILSRTVDDRDSPHIVKSNFFFKACEGRDQQTEQQCVGSPEENEKTCSPLESAANMKSPKQLKWRANSTPKKKRVQTTLRKNIMNGGLKEACCEQISDNTIPSGNMSQPIPDLRLEAKMKAEENARMFAGRQIHPFFSSRQMAKKNSETTDMESNWCSIEWKDKITSFSPIHVFEKVQDDASSIDWGNWMPSERSFVSTNCDLQSVCSPVFEGSVNSLQFDDFINTCPSGPSSLQNEVIHHEEVSLDQSPVQQGYGHATLSTFSADEPAAHYKLLKDMEVNWQDQEMEKAVFLSGHAGCVGNSDVEREGRFLQERMMSYYHGCGNHPENSLWTNKYLPEKGIEVCGNGESVNFLSEWLRLWHVRDFRSRKDSTVGKRFIMQDDDYNFCQSDCNSENSNEEIGLKNVLLVTGPVGSGKSAAIYACAKEQGFHVIEVNASEWRTGTHVMQRFRDSVKLHWLQCTLETPVDSESKDTRKSFPVISNTTAVQGFDGEVIELIPLSDEEDSQNATGTLEKFVCMENRSASGQSESKPLMLFEDVDAIVSEDHGLIAAIQKLAETAKRPMILTCNSDNHLLPNNLDRLELCFMKPSLKELLCHVHMVCAAEKAKIQPCLVERFIGGCQGDIRKTIMHLQFWCQGQRYRKDSKEQKTYGQQPFDLDAGHRILPKLIPLGYPSQLSEFVEKEITKSLLLTEESSKLMEVVTEGGLNKNEMQNHSKRHNTQTDSIEAKKEAILSRLCPVLGGNEFATPFDAACEFSSSSGSPVAFTRRNVRRKLDTVLSSNSGNESLNNRSPVVGAKLYEDTNNEMFLEVDSGTPSYCIATEMCFNPLSEQLLNCKGEKFEESFNPLSEQLVNSKGQKLQENYSHCPETAVYSHINGTCKSVNISCVPELSFVPETEINDGTSLFCRTVSCGHVADIVEAVSTSNDLMQNVQPVETNNLDKSISGLHKIPEMLDNIIDINTESAHREEVGDSHNESVEGVPREYQVMDECSRMDFSRGSKSKDKPRSWMLIDSIQETWRRLRGCHTDLRQYVAPDQKDPSLVLKLTCRMTNLISEADMLLGDCQPLICDSLKPSIVPSEKSHSFGWYDDQLSMTSTIAQHGICLYAKEIAAVGSNKSSVNRMDLAWEMLASSSNTMALGKLVSQDRRIIKSLEIGPPESVTSIKSELDSSLCSVVQSIVPSRLYLATKGDAFYEYLSSLGQISRSETSRLSESIDKTKQRRVRVARNYLSSGTLMLSPRDISLLGQYNCYGKVSFESMDASLR